MTQQLASTAAPDWHKIQQTIKWIVYGLLIINFVFYIVEDAGRAVHTLHAGSIFLDWTGAFATTIDETGWFLLLAMFEIETYVIEDQDWTGWLTTVVHGIRVFCFVLIAHTLYAFVIVVMDLQPTVPVEDISSLCDLSNDNVSYVQNLEYTEVNRDNCGELSSAAQFYWVGNDPVVSDMAGLELERDLALADLAEVVLWLFILLAIEIVVRLQNHGVSGGKLIVIANRSKLVLYGSLIGIGVYWATLGHWLYLWDELVWIGGFAAIEMNLSEWRDEISDKQNAETA